MFHQQQEQQHHQHQHHQQQQQEQQHHQHQHHQQQLQEQHQHQHHQHQHQHHQQQQQQQHQMAPYPGPYNDGPREAFHHEQGPPMPQQHQQISGPPRETFHHHEQGPPMPQQHQQISGPPRETFHHHEQGPPMPQQHQQMQQHEHVAGGNFQPQHDQPPHHQHPGHDGPPVAHHFAPAPQQHDQRFHGAPPPVAHRFAPAPQQPMAPPPQQPMALPPQQPMAPPPQQPMAPPPQQQLLHGARPNMVPQHAPGGGLLATPAQPAPVAEKVELPVGKHNTVGEIGPTLPPKLQSGSTSRVVSAKPVKYDLPQESKSEPVFETGWEARLAAQSSIGQVPTPLPSTVNAVSHALTAAAGKSSLSSRPQAIVRQAGGQKWIDDKLAEWDPDDYRIFVGDLGNDVSDDELAGAFRKYPSFLRARIVRDKKLAKSRGYGFVSLKDPHDFVRAMREMQGQYIGNRPCTLRKSTWQERVDIKSTKRLLEQTGTERSNTSKGQERRKKVFTHR